MPFVVDTNLLVSRVIGTGLPRRLVDGAKAGEFGLCTREALRAELLDMLSRSKFAARLSQAGLAPPVIVDDLRRLAVVVSPTDGLRVVPTEPDDDHVIAAAVTGQADLIVTGDKRDLLPMGSFQGIAIIAAREAVERLHARSETCPRVLRDEHGCEVAAPIEQQHGAGDRSALPRRARPADLG